MQRGDARSLRVPDARTLTALLTPPGPAAIASIGILGPDAIGIATPLFASSRGRSLGELPFDIPLYGCFGLQAKDDVVLSQKQFGDSVEVLIHCHGGAAITRSLLTDIVARGAQQVTWQEYLLAHGEDIVSIETREALARAPTERCAQILFDQWNGNLQRALDRLVANPDPQQANALLRWAPLGLHLVEPWRVLFIGPVNAGKSSLLNAIVGYQRAIVSAEAGTTRDVLRGEISIEGWPLEVLDGPGFRQSLSTLEEAGHAILERVVQKVDLTLLVLDTSQPLDEEGRRLWSHRQPDLVIGNKVDLATPWTDDEQKGLDLRVSAQTGEGIGALLSLLAGKLIPEVPPPGTIMPFTVRQVELLAKIAHKSP